MNWAFRLTREAEEQLYGLQAKQRILIGRSLNVLATDPFARDVKAIKGPNWAGFYRKRMGSYRIIFQLDSDIRSIVVMAIRRRAEKTYR